VVIAEGEHSKILDQQAMLTVLNEIKETITPTTNDPSTKTNPTTTTTTTDTETPITTTMSTPLAGKIAIITGATKGIGRSTAKHLISLGAKVVVSYGGDAPAAEAFIKEFGADHATAVQADGGSLEGVEKLIKATIDKHQKIDILIPNAGRLPMTDIEHLDEANFDKTFALNVKGPMFLVQKAVPYMPEGGRIVLVSTTQNFASTVTPPYMLYCATKGAIDQMTRLLAKDLAKKGITVNCVAPGPTGTDLFFELSAA